MAERIDKIEYDYERLENRPFINSPADFLVYEIAHQIKQVPQFCLLFGENIDDYCKNDYSERALPALRVYNMIGTKEFESWFITGDIKMDVILPASVRRNDLQRIPDTICGALLQQFRRPEFFQTMNNLVPGLNELGKTFSWDKSLGFKWGEDIVPLTQITLNFRVDLRQWDNFLESDYRTKDDPFTRTLKDLESIHNTFQGLNDDGSVNVTLETDGTV